MFKESERYMPVILVGDLGAGAIVSKLSGLPACRWQGSGCLKDT